MTVMSTPDPTPITFDQHGSEVHPSFGVVTVSNVTSIGTRLFDSSIKHNHFIMLRVKRATRKRDLHNDWIHPSEEIVEISMSAAQWGALVSSFGNGSGTPVTITAVDNQLVPSPTDETSRLAITAEEVADKTRQAIAEVNAAFDAVEAAHDEKAGRRVMGAALNNLRHVLGNMPSNMRFAADSLTEHTEKVITKAKADVEAMVTVRAAELGLTAGDIGPVLSLGEGDVDRSGE